MCLWHAGYMQEPFFIPMNTNILKDLPVTRYKDELLLFLVCHCGRSTTMKDRRYSKLKSDTCNNHWLLIVIDGHVCWNSYCRLSLIVCWPRETNFHPFQLQQTNGRLLFPLCCRMQTEVVFFSQFCFPFTEFWKHGDMDMETRRHGDMETRRHGDIEMETWKHGNVDMEM